MNAGGRPELAAEQRLGWTRGLTSDDPAQRARAYRRMVAANRWSRAAYLRYREAYGAWADRGPRDEQTQHTVAAEYAAAQACWSFRQSFTLPAGLWSRREPGGPAESGLLPFMLIYLEWEARHPDDWFTYAKSWSTKHGVLRDLAEHFPRLPTWAKEKLVDLIMLAVHRPTRVEDVGYARLARVVDLPDFRDRLAAAGSSPNRRAGRRSIYLRWLLDHPEAPRPERAAWVHGNHVMPPDRKPPPTRRSGGGSRSSQRRRQSQAQVNRRGA